MTAPRITPSARNNALATIATAPVDPDIHQLRIFTQAPFDCDRGVVVVEHDGVLLKAGEVAVYDRYPLATGEGLIDGGLYAVEFQRPVAGMSWEMWWGKGDHNRSRIRVTRNVVILRRHPKLEDHWQVHPIASRDQLGCYLMSDGPYPEWILTDKILGRIVGIYRPEPCIEVAS